MPENDKALIASSEFDPSNFIRGIDLMTAALDKLSQQEGAIEAELKKIDAALKTNRQEYRVTTDQIKGLDKSSTTYKDDLSKLTATKKALTVQQRELTVSMKAQKDALTVVQTSADKYKTSLQTIAAVTKQVAQETKGKQFFDVVDIKQQLSEITEAGAKLKTIFKGKVSTDEIDKFEKSLESANNEFEEFGKIIAFVKSKMDQFDPNSKEFAELNEIVVKGEQVLEAYGSTLENTGKKSVSLRTQLAALRNQMSVLEEQGKENTQEFQDLALAAGKLQDQMEDTQARIKVLASDTKAIDFGIGAIRGVAAAFGTAEGAAALFGLKSEDVAKSLQRLNAIMLVLNGLQEIQTLLQKQSVVAVVGQEIATKAATVAQRIYAVVVGTSTGALKAFKVALLATGIGAFLILLGFAAKAMDLFGDNTEDAKFELEKFNLALDQSNRKLSNAAKDLQFRNRLGIEAARQRGATEEEISDLVVKGYQNEGRINKETAEKKVKDATSIISKLTEGVVIFDPKSVSNLRQANNALDRLEQAQLRLAQLPGSEKVIENFKTAIDITKDIVAEFQAASDNERKSLEEIANFQTKKADDVRKKAEKDAEQNAANFKAYLEKLAELERQFRDKTLAAQPEDAERIKKEFANQLGDLTAEINANVKLNKDQKGILTNLLGKINKVDLDAALKEFNEQVAAAQKEFDKQQFDLQVRNATERAELIRDQFVREAALVKAESEAQAADLVRERDELIEGINETPGIEPRIKQENIERVKLIYSQLLENLTQQTTRKQEEITANAFQAAQDQTRNIFANVQLLVSETATEEILQAAKAFQAGQINYKEYQKELTRIAEEETDRRIATALREAEALLKEVQKKIPSEQDPGRLKELQDQERELRNRIASLKREQSDADVAGIKKESDELKARIALVATYAQAIGSITQQIVGFWAQANQAEQEQLEKSIALQETRVAAAQRIAERGNAEYLRLEEERLQELQVKQENAARRQLAINAVIQTSQALTAFVSALAQGIAEGGPIGGIAIAAAVIGVIAAGYAIIQSLQPTQRLKGGTKEVRRERGEAPGVDTVPAMLSEGEAVLPVHINKDYKTTVAAIFDKKIPPDVINNFVNNYKGGTKIYPRIDHERMSEATEVRVAYDGELLQATREQNRRLAEQTETLEKVQKTLQNMGVSVNVDRHGLAVSVLKAVEQLKIDQKS